MLKQIVRNIYSPNLDRKSFVNLFGESHSAEIIQDGTSLIIATPFVSVKNQNEAIRFEKILKKDSAEKRQRITFWFFFYLACDGFVRDSNPLVTARSRSGVQLQ